LFLLGRIAFTLCIRCGLSLQSNLVHVSVTFMSSAETAELIQMLLGG